MVKIKLATFYIIFTLIIASVMFYGIRYASQKLTGNYPVDINKLKSWAYVAIVGFGILGVLGALLPYDWGKPVMDTTFLFLLVAILIIEALIVVPFFKPEGMVKPLVPTVECTESPDVGTAQGALNFVTCLFTGYQYDGEQGNWLGITTFLLFYVILPMAFITSLIWGLFSGVKLNKLFGSASPAVSKVMAFVVALYATREVMGGVLLQFFGVSVWGIAAIFIAGIITVFVRNVVVKFIGFELSLTHLKKAAKKEKEFSVNMYKSIRERLKEARKAPVKTRLDMLSRELEHLKKYDLIPPVVWSEIRIKLGNAEAAFESGNIELAKQILDEVQPKIEEYLKS